VCLLVVLGLTQYGFIIARTLQHAPYLEARASNLRELWAVMTARRFAHEIGAYSFSSVMSTRVPIVGGLIGTELGPIGLPLVCVGLGILLIRERRLAVLFGLGALGVASLTANMSSEEDQGFLLSVFVLLWPVVGIGLQAVVAALQRAPRLVAAALVFCAVVLLPYSQIAANYQINDHHADTFETEYFNALFAALPARAAIVNDEYRINMLVLYKLLGEHAGKGRDIRLAPLDKNAVSQLRQDGFEIFAFQTARKDMEAFGFNFAPYEIPAVGATRATLRKRDIFRVLSTPTCFDIGNKGWMDIERALQPKGRMNVRIDNYRAFEAELTVYAGSDQSISPAVMAPHGKGAPLLDVQVFRRASVAAQNALAALLTTDQLDLPAALRAAPFVTRVHVRVNDKGDYSGFALDLGGKTAGAIARAKVDQDTPRRASVCSHPLDDADAMPGDVAHVVFSPDASNLQFDEGWFPTERRSDGYTYRWTGNRAVLLLPLDHPRPTTVAIDAEPLNYPGRVGAMTITINGHRFEPRPLPADRTTLSWNVPLADLRAGLNELVWDVAGATSPRAIGLSPDNRVLGVSVSRIELAATHPRTAE
jgi:hypothetical protein